MNKLEEIATEIAKSFIESGCMDDCIPEYSVEMAKRIIRLCGEQQLNNNPTEYLDLMVEGLVKLIESPKLKGVPSNSDIIRLDMGRAKGNTTLMCMLLNEFKYRDDWKVIPVVHTRHNVEYIHKVFHHKVQTLGYTINQSRGMQYKGNVLVILDGVDDESVSDFISKLWLSMYPDTNLKIVVLG